jgi:TonB family protein
MTTWRSASATGFAFLLLCGFASAGETSPQVLAAAAAEAQRALISGPKPEYPLFARAHHFTGSGIFILRVHVKTGIVAEVRMLRSTGHRILDEAAVRGLSQWRYKPGALTPIGLISPWRHDPFGKEDALLKVPVDFGMRYKT